MRNLSENELNQVAGGGFIEELEQAFDDFVDWLEDKAKPSEGPSGPSNPMPPGI